MHDMWTQRKYRWYVKGREWIVCTGGRKGGQIDSTKDRAWEDGE